VTNGQYHFPSEAPGPDDPIRKELADLGAELVEAKGQARDEGKSKSYHIKAISITDSPWREVLYLVSMFLLRLDSLLISRTRIRYRSRIQRFYSMLPRTSDWACGRLLITGRRRPTTQYGPSWALSVGTSGRWRAVKWSSTRSGISMPCF
jgi:hypothetical protein